MTITETIKALETLREKYGDLRVTIYDDYTANEGWGYEFKDLWLDTKAVVDDIINLDNGETIEKVICFCG